MKNQDHELMCAIPCVCFFFLILIMLSYAIDNNRQLKHGKDNNLRFIKNEK